MFSSYKYYKGLKKIWEAMAPTPLGCSFAPNLEAKESCHLSNHKLDPKKDVKAINKAHVEHLNAWSLPQQCQMESSQ